jgi:hypothetical protein
MEMELKWNGMEMEMEMEWKWKRNGNEMELEWKGNGIEKIRKDYGESTEWRWNVIGMEINWQ